MSVSCDWQNVTPITSSQCLLSVLIIVCVYFQVPKAAPRTKPGKQPAIFYLWLVLNSSTSYLWSTQMQDKVLFTPICRCILDKNILALKIRYFLMSEIATVTTAYNAVTAEQLSLSPGQLILVKKKHPDGWWEGELQVHTFLFYYYVFFFNLILFFFCQLAHGKNFVLFFVFCFFVFYQGSW